MNEILRIIQHLERSRSVPSAAVRIFVAEGETDSGFSPPDFFSGGAVAGAGHHFLSGFSEDRPWLLSARFVHIMKVMLPYF
jgi:hypothetical protein